MRSFNLVAAGRRPKSAEYVKVCSLYGAGFYYIPGTDICMKIGGYVRYQVNAGMGNSISFGPFTTTGGYNTRGTGSTSDSASASPSARTPVSRPPTARCAPT